MTRLRSGAVAAVVVPAAVTGCRAGQGNGAAGPRQSGGAGPALAASDGLPVKGRVPKTGRSKTGRSRDRFCTAWADSGSSSCDTRVVPVLRGMVARLSQPMEGAIRYAY